MFSRRSLCLCLSLFSLAAFALPAQAQVVISQVYGGGGNAGAQYKSDFIELFNAGATPVNLGGWSVQYASAAGTSWQVTTLAGISLQPGQYYLVKEADGAGTQPALPAADATGTIAMSGTAGKVALSNTVTALTGACPVAVDLVGFGSASCPVSPAAPTATLSNTTSAQRKTNGCTNSGNNSADFSVLAPAPRNAGSSFNPCGGAGGPPNLSINDVSVSEGDSGNKNAVFTVSLSSPAGVGGVSFDILTTDGSATDAGGDYVGNALEAQTIPEGSSTYTFTVVVNGDTAVEANETFQVELSNVVGANALDVQGLGTIQNDDFVLVPVHAIQGGGIVSPYAVGTIVATEGIVTARTSNGFFLQTPDSEADLDASTSEGVFVFTSTAPPASATVGNRVRVNATLDEYTPVGQLPLTELKNATIVELSVGNALPAPVVLTDADANATSSLNQLERYEGMRISIASLKVVAPVDGNINEASATSSSNGIFYGVLPTVARPLREPGIDVLDPVVVPPGIVPPVFDHNPELIRVRSNGQTGAAIISVDVGDSVDNLVGVLDYGFGAYTMTPDPTPAAVVALGSHATAVSAPAGDEITIGGFNLLHFFDDVADGDGATKLTTLAYQNRLKKTGNAICAFTHNPDILGVVEVEHIKALGELATSINTNQGNLLFPGSCNDNPGYEAHLFEGNDVGGIDVGFLLKTAEVAPGKSRVEVLSIDQIGKDALFTNADNSTELLNDRPPLVLVARINNANGASQTVTVIANHLRSLIDVDSVEVGVKGWATVGDRVRAKRAEQARFLAQLIQDRQAANPDEKIVLLGDFNAFEFNDGFVDSMGIVTGREAAANQVLRYVPSPITTPLTNTADLAPPAERYSFSFDGNAQSLDHMVVNQAVLDDFAGVRAEHARINADFGIDNYGDFSVPVRVSDHDPVVLFLREASFDTADLAVTVQAASGSVSQGVPMAFTVAASNLGPDAASNAKLTLSITAAPANVAVAAPAGWTCGAPSGDAAGTLVHCTLVNFASGDNANFAITVGTTTLPASGSVTLGAAIAASATDPAAGNNNGSATSSVISLADLGVDITTAPGVVAYGSNFVYTLVASNNGPGDAANATLSLRLDRALSGVTIAAASGWSCTAPVPTAGQTTSNCSRTALPVGSGGFTITVPAAAVTIGQVVSLQASIGSATADGTAGNNSDAVSLQAERVDDLSVDVIPPKTLLQLILSTFRIEPHNAGPLPGAPSGAEAVSLHIGFTGAAGSIVGLDTGGWSCANSAPQAGEQAAWTCHPKTTMAVGATLPVTLRVLPRLFDLGKPMSVNATISSALRDPNPGNNSDSAARTVPRH